MKPKRWGPLLAVGLLWLVVAGALHAAGDDRSAPRRVEPPKPLDLSRPLVDQHGNTVRLADFAGQAVLVTFGYTHCPDFCPVTFSVLSRVYGRMRALAPRLAVVFVTLDPARDTPDVLRPYVNHFNAKFHGLTGSREQVDAVAAVFGARYRIRPHKDDAGYPVDHTTDTYLLDAQGRLRVVFPFGTPVSTLEDIVRAVLQEEP